MDLKIQYNMPLIKLNDIITPPPLNHSPYIVTDKEYYKLHSGLNILSGTGTKKENNSYLMAIYPYAEPRKQHANYTISLNGTLGEGKTEFGIYDSGSSVCICNLSDANKGEDGIYRKVINWNLTGTEGLFIYAIPQEVTTTSTINWIKLEEGEVATDYTPHPSDIYVKKNWQTPQVINAVFAMVGNITTTQFINRLIALGMNNSAHSVFNFAYVWADSPIITDTGIGNVDLSGALVETFVYWANNVYKIRITTGPTITGSRNPVPNTVFVYQRDTDSSKWFKLN